MGSEAVAGYPMLEWIATYGYLVMVPLVILEGNLVAITAGVLASLGALNPFAAGIVFILSELISDSFLWWAGWSGKSFFMRFRPTRRIITRLEEGSDVGHDSLELFKKNFFKILLATKMMPIPQMPTWALVLAGFSRIPYRDLLKAFAIIEPFKAAFYIGLGYFFGTSAQNLPALYPYAIAVLVLLVLGSIFYTKYIHQKLLKPSGLEYLSRKGE
jgi:membrane protein DedA with SNARE-associated domain